VHAPRLLAALNLGCLFVLVACDGNGGSISPTPPTTSTPVPVATVIVEGTFQVEDRATALFNGRPCDLAAFIPFTTTAVGDMEAIVNWTFSTNDINIEIDRGRCDCSLSTAGACPLVAISTSTTAKPENLRLSNLPAGDYTLLVLNFGPSPESGSYQVILTR
jgi:hypothetical protein